MNEAIMHFIWKNRLLRPGEWYTQSGERIQPYSPGQHNQDAGPDFLGARLRIGALWWTGAVEMHWHAMEWYRHRHQLDPAYNQVVLHVVWEGSQAATRLDGSNAETFVMKPWVDGSILDHYRQLMDEEGRFPCASQQALVDRNRYLAMLDRGGLARLEQHTARFRAYLQRCEGNWNQAIWIGLARSFGLKVNSDAMEQLAFSISIEELQSLTGQFSRIREMFNEKVTVDSAIVPLRRLRMRPTSFPEHKLRQLARLVANGLPGVDELLSTPDAVKVRSLFGKMASDNSHTNGHLDTREFLSPTTLQVFIINTLIPALFCYGEDQHLPQEQDRAVQWLEQLGAEQNKITEIFASLNVRPDNALRSQGMIHQLEAYCLPRRCLECAVGAFLLTRSVRKRYAQTA